MFCVDFSSCPAGTECVYNGMYSCPDYIDFLDCRCQAGSDFCQITNEHTNLFFYFNFISKAECDNC